jgi:hypothetical protein
MFGDIGNGVLKGGENSGANYFDCGDGLDTIIDFNPAKGDILQVTVRSLAKNIVIS